MDNIGRVEHCVEELEQAGVIDTEDALAYLERLAGMRQAPDETHARIASVVEYVFCGKGDTMREAKLRLGIRPMIAYTRVSRGMVLQAISNGGFDPKAVRRFKDELRRKFPPSAHRPEDDSLALAELALFLPEGVERNRFGDINWLMYQRFSETAVAFSSSED